MQSLQFIAHPTRLQVSRPRLNLLQSTKFRLDLQVKHHLYWLDPQTAQCFELIQPRLTSCSLSLPLSDQVLHYQCWMKIGKRRLLQSLIRQHCQQSQRRKLQRYLPWLLQLLPHCRPSRHLRQPPKSRLLGSHSPRNLNSQLQLIHARSMHHCQVT